MDGMHQWSFQLCQILNKIMRFNSNKAQQHIKFIRRYRSKFRAHIKAIRLSNTKTYNRNHINGAEIIIIWHALYRTGTSNWFNDLSECERMPFFFVRSYQQITDIYM